MKKFSFSSLRARLILLVFLAVIPALGLIFYAAEAQRRSTALEAQQNALRLARLVSANQHDLIEGARQLLTALAQVSPVRDGQAAPCNAFLADLLTAYPLYANFGVADRNGNIFCSGVPLKEPVNAAERAWFQRAVQTRDFAIGDYQIGRITGRPTLVFGHPVRVQQEVASVVFAALDLSWFNKLAMKAGLPSGTTVTVVDRNGVIFVRYPEPENWIGRTVPDGALRKAIEAQHGEGTADARGMDGSERLYGFTSLGDGAAGATVLVGIAKGLAFASVDRIMANSMIWLMMVLLLALAGAWWGGNWLIVRQLKKLMEATEQLGTGDLAARVSVSNGKGELHQLARAFNRMAQGLQQRESAARQAQDELQRLLRQSTALREINLAVTSTLDLHAMLGVLMEKIEVLLPETVELVWLRDRESGKWERTACRNIDEAEWKHRELRGTPPIVKAAIDNQSPVLVPDLPNDPRIQDPEFYRRHRLASYLAVPLIVKGEVLGVLAFLTRERHEFTDEEIEFLSMLAGQAAVAIHNSQLHEQTKRQAVELEKANDDLRRKEAIQSLLKELSQDIASQDVEALLKKLTDKVREFFKVDVADVRIIDHGVPRILGVSGIDEEKMRLGSTGSGRGASGWILENRRPLVIPDITKVEDPPIGRTTRRIGIHGYLAVPFFSRSGEVLGVLRALTYQPRDFLQEDIDLLQQMTNGAGIALENARLLEQITTQAAELMQANKVKNEFLGFISHELRTPVNVIVGYAAIIQSKMLGEINAEQDNALEKMSVNSKELLSMIDQLLEATKIEAGAVEPEIHEVQLSGFLDELKTAYSVPLNKEIVLSWDYPADLSVIGTDGEKLRHILLNVVNNAIKYTKQGNVAVRARHLAEAGQVEFEVADTGIGIPKEELPRIFEMFSQVKGARSRSSGGVGLGLHIVKKFTEVLGGEIRVTSEVGRGSTFTIRIPCDGERQQAPENPNLPAVDAVDLRQNQGAARARPLPPADS